jgi:dipeptidyl aminopeptidase/acylaminoacyl peptidase
MGTHFARPASWVLALLAAATAHASGRALTPDDFYRIQEVHEPQVSPDGAQVAYLVSHNDRDRDDYETTLWLVPWQGGDAVQLTRGAGDILAPRFSPDGRYISYVAVAPDAEQGRLMLLDRRGGEPRQLATVSSEGNSYAWSPDGARLVVSIPDDATVQTRVPLPIVIDGRHFKEDTVGYLTAASLHHLALLDVASGQLSELAHDVHHNDELPQWSPRTGNTCNGRRTAAGSGSCRDCRRASMPTCRTGWRWSGSPTAPCAISAEPWTGR